MSNASPKSRAPEAKAARAGVLGPKLRKLRQQQRLTQADLARQLGISASYLNLIEHDRRGLSVELLVKLGEFLPIDLKSLSPAQDGRTTAELLEVFSDPLFQNADVGVQEISEMVTASPTGAALVLGLYEAFRTARKSAQDLGETLSQGAALQDRRHSRFPSEEVSDLIQQRMNYFPELDHAGETVSGEVASSSKALFDGLADFLGERCKVEVRIESTSRMRSAIREYDPDRRLLFLSEGLRRARRNFQVAYQIGLLTQEHTINRIVADPVLTTEESRASCRVALANYFAAAVLMPYGGFLETARSARYDIERLGNRFDTSFEQTCHRLATLRRPGAEGIPFHMLRVDIAGNMSKRFSASGLQIPRFSGACPRWNTFGAFLTPGVIRTQLSQMPDGRIFFGVAKTVRGESGAFSAHQPLYAIGIGCDISYAESMVYADGLNLTNPSAVVPVGPSCRLCERTDCEQRAYPPVHHPFRIDENRRGVSFYAPPPAEMSK